MSLRTAIIPCAGLGTRLLPLTLATCKELLPVAGQPALVASLSTALAAGLTRIRVITTPQKSAVRTLLEPRLWPSEVAGLPALAPLRALLERLELEIIDQPYPPLGVLDSLEYGLAKSELPCVVLFPDMLWAQHRSEARTARPGLASLLAAHEACGQAVYGLHRLRSGSPHGPTTAVELHDGPLRERIAELLALPPETPWPEELLGVPLPIRRLRPPAEIERPAQTLWTTLAQVHTTTARTAIEAVCRTDPRQPLDDRHLLGALNQLAERGQLQGALLPGEVLDLGTLPGYLDATQRLAAGRVDLLSIPAAAGHAR